MKHIRKFESYRIKKRREEIIRESVLQVDDLYKVKTMIDIPQSLINAYIKKVKDTTGKNLRQFFGDVDIAEEIVKYINLNNLDVDKIPGGALMGGQVQAQDQVAQPAAQTQTQQEPPAAQAQQQVPAQGQPAQGQPAQGQPAQGQPAQGQPAQGQPAQGQAQPQAQQQEPAQAQAQPQVQVQAEGGQNVAEFEEPKAQGQEGQEEEEEEEEENTEGEEELPL